MQGDSVCCKTFFEFELAKLRVGAVCTSKISSRDFFADFVDLFYVAGVEHAMMLGELFLGEAGELVI